MDPKTPPTRRARPHRVPTRRILDVLARTYPDARCALRYRNPYELLVATVLSAQSTDRLVNRITPGLFARFPGPRELAAADPSEVAECIRACGLYRTKARNLVAAARRLVEEHGGEVPRDRAALESLPGVGRKTANVVLSNAFEVPAIAVDTHVFRVANRLGLAEAGDPLETERQLMRRIPRRDWAAAHHRLIHHGRQVCRARNPLCPLCPLEDLCRHARAGSRASAPEPAE